MSISAAVCVRDVVKKYGDKTILDGLCMNVDRGTIYGLLGASGCGKTTLLSCMVGRKSINSGEIWVLGGTPGEKGSGVPGPRVGYMPQEIALVGEFTVRDAVFYFGRILNMPETLISERFEKLSMLLDLPPDDRFLKNCSGGQQRRVSFAAAMVHMPELLILDEPTAGVDPLLRDKIWNYLVEIVHSEKIAVIITTHYIEEARRADKIGLMRNGKLLAEESPARLLQLFHTETLEEAFLILSRNQEDGIINSVMEACNRQNGNGVIESASSTTSVATFDMAYGSKDELTKEKKTTKIKKDNTSMESYRMKALLDKNWKQFYRNVTGIVFLISFPLLQTLCFLHGVGGEVKDLKLGIVNDETMTTRCSNFVFNGTTEIHDFDCNFYNMSCRFLEYLEHPMIAKVKFNTLDEAITAITHGQITGALYMAENFTQSYQSRIEDGKDAESWISEFGEIKAYLDMSNRQIGMTLKFKLYKLFYDFQEEVFRECNWPARLGNLPMRREYMYGDEEEVFTIFMIPGTLVTMCFFLGSMMTSQIIITDRKDGVWDRSIVAGVTSLEIILTHFILQASIMVVQAIEVLFTIFVAYQYTYIGSTAVMFLLTYFAGICGMAYGFWVSTICEDHSQANISVTGGFLPMMLLCGLIWPLEAMPIGLRIFAKCLPFTLAIESLRNVIKKGWPLWDFQVFQGFGVLLLWILGLGIISVWAMKLKR